jgi:hypothetical protein
MGPVVVPAGDPRLLCERCFVGPYLTSIKGTVEDFTCDRCRQVVDLVYDRSPSFSYFRVAAWLCRPCARWADELTALVAPR